MMGLAYQDRAQALHEFWITRHNQVTEDVQFHPMDLFAMDMEYWNLDLTQDCLFA
jgi:hypothetical protein